MDWIKAHRLLVGTALVAAHIVMAFSICSLALWLYFQAGVKWTPDPAVPQIEGMLALIGQATAALIFVPTGLIATKNTERGLLIAMAWPLAYPAIAFLLPNVFVWLVAAIGLFALGIAELRRSA